MPVSPALRVAPKSPQPRKSGAARSRREEAQGATVLTYAEAMALAKDVRAKRPPKPGEKSLWKTLRDSPLRARNAEQAKRGLPEMEFDRSLPPESER